jgi:hypothetical protein
MMLCLQMKRGIHSVDDILDNVEVIYSVQRERRASRRRPRGEQMWHLSSPQATTPGNIICSSDVC